MSAAKARALAVINASRFLRAWDRYGEKAYNTRIFGLRAPAVSPETKP